MATFDSLAEYQSAGSATEAYWDYVRERGDDGPSPGPTRNGWSGGLQMPEPVPYNGSWDIEVSITNEADQARQSSFVVAVEVPGEQPYGQVTEFHRPEIAADGTYSDTWTVPRGNYTGEMAEDGQEEFFLLMLNEQGEAVVLDSVTVEVADPGERPGGEGWSEAIFVQELEFNWALWKRVKEDPESGEITDTQWMIGGRREDDTPIFLASDGTIQETPEWFDERETAMQALQRYAQRLEQGEYDDESERPAPGATRLTPEEIRQATEQGAFATRRRRLIIGGILVGLIILWWARREGHLDGLARKAGRTVGKVERKTGINLPGGR